jgi:NitT/TauT family transport system ATP-binding protein
MIEVHDVSHRFRRADGDHVVLTDIQLTASAGEIVGIVGPSGCGKTTLLRIMAGLLSPSAGEVRLQGVPVHEPGQGVVLVFQDYGKSLFPWKTVAQNVLTGAHGRTGTDRELDDLLRMVDLSDHRDRHPWELSGGMQQRVAIARAFMRKPRVVLMDEPFGSLDGLTRYGLQSELLRWARTLDIAVVLVTHDLDEAAFLCNRILVLSRRPASVIAQLHVELPEPREPVATRRAPAFVEVRANLQQRLSVGT